MPSLVVFLRQSLALGRSIVISDGKFSHKLYTYIYLYTYVYYRHFLVECQYLIPFEFLNTFPIILLSFPFYICQCPSPLFTTRSLVPYCSSLCCSSTLQPLQTLQQGPIFTFLVFAVIPRYSHKSEDLELELLMREQM